MGFLVTAKTQETDGKTKILEIRNFESYVERVIKIPEGVDPSKVTTGIVFNPDGTYSHVPTELIQKDDKYYAKLNSLTNSTYSIIFNPLSVKTVEGHWSEEMVNDMASRLIIVDTENFKPDTAITRAEFADYIVRALGLYREDEMASKDQLAFADINENHPFVNSITIANEWNIVSGYPDGTFQPKNTITREEAMMMYAKVMEIVKLEGANSDRIVTYQDAEEVSDWAYNTVNDTLSAGVFNGRTADKIAPKETLTHAEAATAIRNLLVEAKLINH